MRARSLRSAARTSRWRALALRQRKQVGLICRELGSPHRSVAGGSRDGTGGRDGAPRHHEPVLARRRAPRRQPGGHRGAGLLAASPRRRATLCLADPPMGQRRSVTSSTGASDLHGAEELALARPDFWEATSHQQLNFIQHVYTLLEIRGRAAVVVPDGVLFMKGRRGTGTETVAETVRRAHPAPPPHRVLRRLLRGKAQRPVLREGRGPPRRIAGHPPALGLPRADRTRPSPIPRAPVSTRSSPPTGPGTRPRPAPRHR